jgi:trans-aconitate methyltransferase
MAAAFGEVHGVDVSGEMIAPAKSNLAGVTNVSFYKNNGRDLANLSGSSYDFAFSCIVFQHIPAAGGNRELRPRSASLPEAGSHLHVSGAGRYRDTAVR